MELRLSKSDFFLILNLKSKINSIQVIQNPDSADLICFAARHGRNHHKSQRGAYQQATFSYNLLTPFGIISHSIIFASDWISASLGMRRRHWRLPGNPMIFLFLRPEVPKRCHGDWSLAVCLPTLWGQVYTSHCGKDKSMNGYFLPCEVWSWSRCD